MTTEELQKQISALSKQLQFLQKGLIDVGRGKGTRNNMGNTKKYLKYLEGSKVSPKIISNEEVEENQEQYRKELSKLTEESHKILNPKKKEGIVVNIYQPNISELAEKIFRSVDGCKIEIIDNYKIIEGENKLFKKYRRFLPQPCPTPGIGAAGPDGWVNITTFLLAITASWLTRHVFSDLDDFLWSKIKTSFLKIYKLLRRNNDKKDIVIIASYDLSAIWKPTIIFILPIGLRLKEVKKAVKKIPQFSKNAISEFKKNKDTAIFEFRYDKIINDWSVSRRKRIG